VRNVRARIILVTTSHIAPHTVAYRTRVLVVTYRTTLCFKKLHPFYFCDNFVGHEPMLTIFGRNVAKEIGNMQRLAWLLFTVQMSYG